MYNMTVGELIDQLSNFDADAEVRFASQPSWPFEYSIDDVVMIELPEVMTRAQFDALSEDEQEAAEERADIGMLVYLEDDQEAPTAVVYLAEGHQIGYLPGNVSKKLGWR